MSKHVDIIFLGDSLTFGYGVPKKDSWVYKIQNNINVTSLNKGCNGDTSIGMLNRYYEDVIRYTPIKIFIMCGSNDLLLGRTVKSIIENIELMIKDSLEINSNVVIGIPPSIIGAMANKLFSSSPFYTYAEENLIKLREAIINLAVNYSLSYIDFYSITLNNSDIYLDGIHLNSLGNEIMYKNAVSYF
ncbi:GDSL family lipase [Clostridium botulinum]|nr:GDSL family lipase [Clostridium botulinum]NFG27478.1 GDSL family lipase [Clostridium botulinum]NFO03982.1 GDSL family lipase [Clostridium botulinum]NFO46089.1 GDSL family lipase [Clostridium botulinum]NFR15510.1 GDSL family lipase [Clostridium botulinum]